MGSFSSKTEEWISSLKNGSIGSIDDFLKLLKFLNSLDSEFPMTNASQLIAKCERYIAEARHLAKENENEAKNILDVDSGERVVCMTTMAVMCAVLCNAWGAAAATAATEGGITLSISQKAMYAVGRNLIVQSGLQFVNGGMNCAITGDAQINPNMLAINGLINLTCAGGVAAVGTLKLAQKVAFHVLRIAILDGMNIAVGANTHQAVLAQFAAVPKEKVRQLLPDAKVACRAAALDIGETICQSVWTGVVNADTMNEIFATTAKSVAAKVPKLHWMTKVFCPGDPQAELDQAVKRCARYAMEAHLYSCLMSAIAYQKFRFQLFAAGVNLANDSQIYTQ